ICIGHRGLLRLVLRAAGKAVHSGSAAWSQGRDGANALTGLAAILLRLEALEIPTAEQPAFVGLGNKITPTLLRGGEFESMVPAHAEALVDVRLLPGVSPQGVVDRVKQAIAEETARRPGLVVSVEVKNSLPGAAIPADHPLVKLAEEYTQTLTGRTWLAQGAGPANEGYMLIQAGIPTLCGFGPQGDNAHAPDEWVDLESLPRTVAIYAGMVREYLEGGV
ncbi:MAG: M20/M25/M40 family metallo-hydrolase, partial [Chloroflexi bacterium]|nr:M20/M25/M40 family metallo-hydrolase [Chloroflexota bacterium]